MKAALGRKGDYSVRAVLDLARRADGGRRKAREIAVAMEIPERYLTQILANLVRQGLLIAEAGPDGGYSLARPAEDVTLLDVVEAAEGPIRIEQCVLRGGPCDWESVCPVHEAWSRAQKALTDELSATTFAELANIDASIEMGQYRIPDDTPPHSQQVSRKGKRV